MEWQLVFDFDGTLADTMASSIAIFQEIGPGLGLKPYADVNAARAMPTRKLLRKIGVTFWNLPRVVKAFQTCVAKHAHEIKLHTGVPEALAAIHATGTTLGILSSNREDNIRKCLAANGVEQYFKFVVGYPQLFGKARALRRIRRRQGFKRSQIMYIGDESRDLQAARRAGLRSGAACWGYHTPELLARYKPTVLLQSPSELVALAQLGQPSAG